MTKELEALEKFLFNQWKQNHVNFCCDYKLEAELDKQLNNLKSVKQSLLKAQELEKLLDHERELNNHLILKEQEQEKVLKIVFEKNVDILELRILIKHYNAPIALKIYNSKFGKGWQLTEEEFNFIKECL